MSIRISIPNEVAGELYWLMDELDERMSIKTRRWFVLNYKPKMQAAWNRKQDMDAEVESEKYRKASMKAEEVYDANVSEIDFARSELAKCKVHDLYDWLYAWDYSWNPHTKEWES